MENEKRKWLCDDLYKDFEQVFLDLEAIGRYYKQLEEAPIGDESYIRYRENKIKAGIPNSLIKYLEEEIEPSIRNVNNFLDLVNGLMDKISLIYSNDEVSKIKEVAEIALRYKSKIQNMDFTVLDDQNFKIPDEISDNAIRSDLEEAIKDFKYRCFASSMAMCRRAYEGTLYLLFFNIERNSLPANNMSLIDLYEWFKKKGLYERFGERNKEANLLNLGYWVKKFGDISVHAPRDESSSYNEEAKAAIANTIMLLKEFFLKFPELSGGREGQN